MENAGGVGGVGGDQSMLAQNNSDLDNLSNLLINSYEDDAAILDQYELELEKNLQESLIMEKEQHNQRLFQSFQTSACAVAQMFKDKSSAQQQPAQSLLSSWESFQNSAGAITVLYKDSLEACRVHMDLGIHLGQQRKVKDLINWIKKKKKRSIRKDELISFLIGKQYPSQQNQMFNLFRPQQSSTHPNPFNANLGHMLQSQTPNPMNNRSHRNHQRQRSTLVSTNSSTNPVSMANNVNNTNSGGAAASNMPLIANPALNLLNNGENSNGSEVDNTSDLATFREALIMHNRSRDTPLNRNHPASHTHSHHHHHHHHHHHPNNNNNNNTNQSANHTHLHQSQNQNASNNNQQQQQTDSGATQQQQQATNGPNCDDLDCFFCEQIATHIEHKRSSANLNFDADSPTRKRSRFY